MLLARILSAQGDWKAAFAAYSAVPDTLPVEILLGPVLADMFSAYAEGGKYRGCVEGEVEGGPAMGPSVADYCLSAHDAVGILHQAYVALRLVGSVAIGRTDYQRARELFSAAPAMPVTVWDTADSEGWIGETYVAEKDYEKSVALCEEMLVKYAGTIYAVRAQYAIGQCRRWQGRYEEAREAYERVIEMSPGTSWEKAARDRMDEMQTPVRTFFGRSGGPRPDG